MPIPIERSFASHKKHIFWSKKNKKQPNEVYKSSHSKYLFDCNLCGHEFESQINSITNSKKWCGFCSNPPKKLCNNENCKDCFDKSFSSHPRSNCWSKNNKISHREIFKSSNKKCLFDCEVCGHEFENSLNSITNSKSWCGFCANQKLCNNENCKLCFEKSFAQNPKSNYWSSKNKISPREMFKSSNKKCLFDCEVCEHTFESTLNDISAGCWCNYCANKKLCNNENCKLCNEKSFASHEKFIFWSSKNDKSPREMFKNSNSKWLFVCEKKHKFSSSLDHITICGRWCPKCINKTETKLCEKMIQIYPSIMTQFKQEWCKNISYLPFDFCIPEPKIIIELDGLQHFKQVMNWSPPEEQFERDRYKEKCANDNGYSTIRIIQEDVLNDKYDWCKELCEAIENIKSGNKIVNIYLCKNNEYVKYLVD